MTCVQNNSTFFFGSWRHDSSRIFSVKSAYLVLTSGVVHNGADSLLARVWKSWAPSKVIVFSWQLFQDRVPTRQNLLRRRVIRDPSGALCAFCAPRGVFQGFLALGLGRKNRLRWLLIWHATVWTIWNSRNDIIFARGTVSVESLVDKVKLSSWKWYLAKNPGNPCSFYEWEVHPILCWSR
ncbi:hypothetical protein TSUD_230690 [Trifolium subterraneum]|nr:hypothetical protein TSUD_230690 [Trifolium subterraneum]